jgi:hypothetical protein
MSTHFRKSQKKKREAASDVAIYNTRHYNISTKARKSDDDGTNVEQREKKKSFCNPSALQLLANPAPIQFRSTQRHNTIHISFHFHGLIPNMRSSFLCADAFCSFSIKGLRLDEQL